MIYFDFNNVYKEEYSKRLVNFSFYKFLDQLEMSLDQFINEVLVKSNESIDSVASIGITNQRETAIVWDKNTGMPVYNAVVWQSRQSQDICEQHASSKELIHKKTGLLINPYFSASSAVIHLSLSVSAAIVSILCPVFSLNNLFIFSLVLII